MSSGDAVREAEAFLAQYRSYDWLTTNKQADWTVEQVAKGLGISERTVQRAIDSGELLAADMRGRVGYRIPREELVLWVRSQFTDANQSAG